MAVSVRKFMETEVSSCSCGSLTSVLTMEVERCGGVSRRGSIRVTGTMVSRISAALGLRRDSSRFLGRVTGIGGTSILVNRVKIKSHKTKSFFIREGVTRVISSAGATSLMGPSRRSSNKIIGTGTGGSRICVAATISKVRSHLDRCPFLNNFRMAETALHSIYMVKTSPITVLDSIRLTSSKSITGVFSFATNITTISRLISIPVMTKDALHINKSVILNSEFISTIKDINISGRPPATEGKTASNSMVLLARNSNKKAVAAATLCGNFFSIM